MGLLQNGGLRSHSLLVLWFLGRIEGQRVSGQSHHSTPPSFLLLKQVTGPSTGLEALTSVLCSPSGRPESPVEEDAALSFYPGVDKHAHLGEHSSLSPERTVTLHGPMKVLL